MAVLTVSEFSAEIGTDPRTARRFLRSITPKDKQPGKGSRWAIEKRELRSLRKKFEAFSAAELAKKNARESEKESAVEIETELDTDDSPEPTDAELAEIEND